MQREDCELRADPDDHKGDGHPNRPGIIHILQSLGHIDHVERARHLIHQTDANQQERRPDRAHDQVRERGH